MKALRYILAILAISLVLVCAVGMSNTDPAIVAVHGGQR